MRKKIRESDFLTNQNYHKTEEMQNVLENSEMKKIFLYLKHCPKNRQKSQKCSFLSFISFLLMLEQNFFQF